MPPNIFGSDPVGSIFGSNPVGSIFAKPTEVEESEEYEYYEESDEYYSDEYYDDSEELNEVLEQARQKSTFTFHFDQGTRSEPVTATDNSLDFETTTTTEPPITTQRFRDFGAFTTISSLFPILTTTRATTTTTPRPTTRPKVEMFDGVIVRQIENNRIKNVGTVDVQEPIVVNSQRPEIVLGTFKNMLNDDYVNQQSSEEEEYEYYSDEYYSDEYYSNEEYYEDSDIDNRLAKLGSPFALPSPQPLKSHFVPNTQLHFVPSFQQHSALSPLQLDLSPQNQLG